MDTPPAIAFTPLLHRMTWLYTYCALLVIRFARNGIEGALRHLIGVGFHEVEWNEYLTRRNNFGDSQLQVGDASSARYHVHPVVRLQFQSLGVTRVHLQPRVGRHSFKDRDLSSLCARVPVLNRASGIEHEWKFAVRLFGEGLPLDAEQIRLAVFGLKVAVAVQASRGYLGCSRRKWPLYAAAFLDHLVIHSRVIAEPSRRHLLPLF